MMKKSEMRNTRLEEMRKKKAKNEMAECTFKPAIRKSARPGTMVGKKRVSGQGSTLFQRALVGIGRRERCKVCFEKM